MDDWQAALLGLVQGLTEFLPVSSSGHLVIASHLLGEVDESIVFEIVVHVGTLLAILVFYRSRVAGLVRGVFTRDPDSLRYVGKLVVATLPAVAIGLTLKDEIAALFGRPSVVGVALLVTTGLLWTTRSTAPRARAAEPGWWQALGIGFAQALAIVPGISRSGTTVAVGMALGVAPVAATEFSFMMAIAAIAGAAVLALPDAMAVPPDALRAFAIGGAFAMLSGLAALWLFVWVLRKQRFHQFAYYTAAAGLAFLAWLSWGP